MGSSFNALMSNVIVWDIETVPDLKGFAAANGHVGKTDDEVRAELGDKFPKHIYHSIICIGALVAHREEGGNWITRPSPNGRRVGIRTVTFEMLWGDPAKTVHPRRRSRIKGAPPWQIRTIAADLSWR